MRTEARRKYSCGFVLTEQELRRIHDVADQQMKRALADGRYSTEYELKFRNGALSEPKSLDEIFEGENWGSAAITRVAMYFREVQEGARTRIGIRFSDTNATDDPDSISYMLEGDDRDWVFVASSSLSERITRIERFNVGKIFSSRLVLPFMLFAVILSMIFMISTVDRSDSPRSEAVKALRQEWTDGTLHDPVDVVPRVEELNRGGPGVWQMMRGMGVPVISISLILLFRGTLSQVCGSSLQLCLGGVAKRIRKKER